MIGKGKRIEDLYVLDMSQKYSSLIPVNHVIHYNNEFIQIWHSKLDHLYDKCLAMIKSQLHCNRFTRTDPCYICPLAKQKRLPFISHNTLLPFPFDLIHCDIWGPYHVHSHSGHKYFLTLVDDCTRFTWIFLLKEKSDVAKVSPKFYNFVLTQFDKRVKQFRSDNA